MEAQHAMLLVTLLKSEYDVTVNDPGPAGEETLVDREHVQSAPCTHTTTRLA